MKIRLKILSPAGILADVTCDSVRLPVSDGGGCGIKPGHAPELISLGAGIVSASLDGKEVISREIPSGIASVMPDSVSVITE